VTRIRGRPIQTPSFIAFTTLALLAKHHIDGWIVIAPPERLAERSHSRAAAKLNKFLSTVRPQNARGTAHGRIEYFQLYCLVFFACHFSFLLKNVANNKPRADKQSQPQLESPLRFLHFD